MRPASLDKDITISDLALRLGIAPSTVSRALNDHPSISKNRKAEILKLATQFGYRSNDIARNLRVQRTNTIAVIVPRLNSYLMSSLVAGIEQLTNANGYSLLLSDSGGSVEKEAQCAKAMYKNRPDGLVVCLSPESGSLHHLQSFIRRSTPVVCMGTAMEQEGLHRIEVNNWQAGYDAGVHLIEQGCQRIMHVSDSVDFSPGRQRFDGFGQALKAKGLVFSDADLLITDMSPDSGSDIARRILALPQRPDGLFIGDDDCAIACMQALKTAGVSIPRDIALVGFGNDPVSRVVEPGLTSLNYPGFEIGQLAATHLLQRLSGGTAVSEGSSISAPLLVRGSSLRNL